MTKAEKIEMLEIEVCKFKAEKKNILSELEKERAKVRELKKLQQSYCTVWISGIQGGPGSVDVQINARVRKSMVDTIYTPKNFTTALKGFLDQWNAAAESGSTFEGAQKIYYSSKLKKNRRKVFGREA